MIGKQVKLASEDNFVAWKNLIQTILKTCGCWPYITTRRVRPTKSSSSKEEVSKDDDEDHNPEQQAQDMKDQHAFVILMNSLTPKIVIQFGSKETSSKLWEALFLCKCNSKI